MSPKKSQPFLNSKTLAERQIDMTNRSAVLPHFADPHGCPWKRQHWQLFLSVHIWHNLGQGRTCSRKFFPYCGTKLDLFFPWDNSPHFVMICDSCLDKQLMMNMLV